MVRRLGSQLTLFVLAAALVGATACATVPARRERVYVRVAPPPARVEVVGRAPAPGYIWMKGYYRWDGGDRYTWVPGRWVAAERGRAWVPGRWAHDRRGWFWVDGHWR